MMRCFTIFTVLLACSFIKDLALAQTIPVTSDEDQNVKAVAQAFVDFEDSMSVKYGNFQSPLSFSSGPAATLNETVTGNICFPPPLNGPIVGLMFPEYLNFFTNYAMPGFTYLEYDSINGTAEPVLNVTGINAVSCGLVEIQVFEKDYLQTQSVAFGPVIKIDTKTFVVEAEVITSGLSAKPACEANPFCFLSSPFDANAQDFYIQGPIRFTVIRQSGNYLLSQYEAWARITRYGGVFQPQLLSFIPFPSFVPGANA